MTGRAAEVALPVAGLFGVVSGAVVYQFLFPGVSTSDR